MLHLVGDEKLLDIAHHLQGEFDGEDAGVLALVLFQDIGLHRTANIAQDHLFDLSCLLPGRACVPFPSRNFSTCWSMAVFMNIARMIGAGPLMVMDTEVVGEQRSKPS